jgi:SAM-dependent methyltransferase
MISDRARATGEDALDGDPRAAAPSASLSVAASASLPASTSPSWDYDPLARHYDERAPYHPDTLSSVLGATGVVPAGRAVDVGAGTGRFTRELAAAGFAVDAVEPARAMRAIGEERCRGLDVRWLDMRGEATALPGAAYAIVAFASSFNVVEPAAALAEAARLLQPGGWLACLWNHRDLADPLQAAIESRVRARVPEFRYGRRRDDPTPLIAASGYFSPVRSLALAHVHRTPAEAFVDGFRAHATLVRQAGARLDAVLADVRALLAGSPVIEVPFTTRVWLARCSAAA